MRGALRSAQRPRRAVRVVLRPPRVWYRRMPAGAPWLNGRIEIRRCRAHVYGSCAAAFPHQPRVCHRPIAKDRAGSRVHTRRRAKRAPWRGMPLADLVGRIDSDKGSVMSLCSRPAQDHSARAFGVIDHNRRRMRRILEKPSLRSGARTLVTFLRWTNKFRSPLDLVGRVRESIRRPKPARIRPEFHAPL